MFISKVQTVDIFKSEKYQYQNRQSHISKSAKFTFQNQQSSHFEHQQGFTAATQNQSTYVSHIIDETLLNVTSSTIK